MAGANFLMNTKQNVAVLLAFIASLVPGMGMAASQSGYRVTAPPAFPIFNTNSPSLWAATNGGSVVWTAGGSATQTNGLCPESTKTQDKNGYRLMESAIGSPIEHIKPEYYLGDQIVAPSNVNWIATFASLANSEAYTNNFVFYDASVPGIFFCGGGLISVNWILMDGSTNAQSYLVSGTSKSKPYRIYWTDEPYNSPPVDLTGKYVSFFGDPVITIPKYDLVTSNAGGMPSTTTNVVRGLFLDTATHWLQARGEIEGKVVMAYYRTGSKTELLGTIVVEVCRPDIRTVSGEIGHPLLPTGDGYDVVGLSALVTHGIGDSGDDVGDYVYQHKGDHSYSPKNGNIYAIRKSVGKAWDVEVYWRQTDLLGTSWPFEILQYECDWPNDAVTFVRGQEKAGGVVNNGLPVQIPSAYTASLMEYQEPAGHASLANNVFSAKTNGYSLVQLTGADTNGDDNVWFVPVHSVERDDPQFDLTAGTWPVGVEVTPLPTSIALAFNGTSAFLSTPITNQLNGSFTVEGFFQANKADRSQCVFFKPAHDDVPDFKVEVDSQGKVRATFGVVGTNALPVVWWEAGRTVGMGDGLWHHVALTYDADTTNAQLCLDSSVTSSTVTGGRIAQHEGALTFGNEASSNFFGGKLDDLRVWSRALTTNEIQRGSVGFLHNAASATNLVAYYPIDNGIGRVLSDASGHGLDAGMVECTRTSPGAIGLSDLDGFSKYHAYIYEPVSGNNYNTNLYVRPDQLNTGDDPTDTGSKETYLFGVNKTKDKPLEVWWSHEVWQADMPAPLWFPAWVQRYSFAWPTENYEVPEIVLASQLGSANKSLVKRGVAVDFSLSANSRMRVPDDTWFAGDTYTAECWVKPHNLVKPGQVFNFNNGDSCDCVSLTLLGDGTYTYRVGEAWEQVQIEIGPTNKLRQGWNHLALVVDGNTATVYQDSHAVLITNAVPGLPHWSVATTNNYLAFGVQSGATNSFDGQIDEFCIWGSARTPAQVYNDMLVQRTGSERDLRLCYTFDGDVETTSEARYALDLVNNVWATITSASWTLPGAPRLDTGVLIADDAPFVYYQNTTNLPGYNPNEEHAFVRASEGGYVTYALRCDLNVEASSEPYVLVQYNDPANDGRPNMQVYHVVLTNQVYAQFADTMTAGTLVPGPHPLDLLPDPWNAKTDWDHNAYTNSPESAGYRDRKLQIWAKCAGTNGLTTQLVMRNFYPMQDGFFFPSLAAQPALNTPVPWLSGSGNPLGGTPQSWTWTVSWPSNAPVLHIGQTLTKAKDDLPEVWGAKSIKRIYQPVTNAAALYDPVIIQTAGLEFEGNFASAFGFDSGSQGKILQRNGLTYFKGVSPNISDRFYFDPAASKSACLKLKGRLVEDTGGLSYLQLNVLSPEERIALEGLVSNEHSNEWSEAVEKLATARVDTDDAHAVVNYALTHMGPGAGGYVTLIENDATNPVFRVNAGDPIQMHIIQLSTNLYTGNLLPLKDPNNLLSEQLDILYTESFAGQSSDFEFQWKRTEPNANGTTPSDYVNQYSLYRDEAGLTRFTIGKQGDTLPDMVNNFYVMRYRAITNTPAYDATGGAWSDWVAPTLAEGWVQRVVNGVTPFTQRMQDLYNNAAETTVSMIQQAGPPYEGDVALNQDNLTSVGLIQLYQSVLNKAESMSLRMGINDTAANQQLMLAATRLNDLYMLLGNEAYADAMDPTIGFGSDFYNSSSLTLGGVDYGSLSSSLFCFDNLEPNLREEELALLRGRSDGDLAPSLQLSPTYNRLYWNFTKGITAGEVAYAMNYQIQGSEATIDQPQAAALYPQGHGDAWGHYLSALTGYYRLMRNPYFSWGTPSISPLMVGDAVVDADYYDEEKFAESAAAMARAGVEIVRRTSEKAYVENGGTAMAGYRDEDANRAFGYGEWGARAGLSSLYNWAAANSLLPQELDPTSYDFLAFATNTQMFCLSPSKKIDFSSSFTLEFKIRPDAAFTNAGGRCALFDWHAADATRDSTGAIGVALDGAANGLVFQVQDLTNALCTMALPPRGTWSHVAVTYSAESNRLALFLNGVQRSGLENFVMPDSVTLTNAVAVLASNDSSAPFSGALAEFRIWNVARSAADLVAARDGVSAVSDGLLMYQRFIGDKTMGARLPDEACSATWQAENPLWTTQASSGAALAFVDNSILRINRSSVGSLEEICSAMKAVQRSVDEADAGMTPLGLSDSAIPFDIDPAELAAGKSHFEQIEERAEVALANAATLLDRAQTVSKLQRQQTQNAINIKQDLANEESALNTQLIGIFGYPYSGDIGAGATYPQDYDGPDLYHYMWMDLGAYGFSDFELAVKTSEVVKVTAGVWLSANTSETMTLKFDLASNGMVIKPSEITGTRCAQGRLQAAYGSFIHAYLEYRKALIAFDEKTDFMNEETAWLGTKLGILDLLGVASEVKKAYEVAKTVRQLGALIKLKIVSDIKQGTQYAESTTLSGIPTVLGVGLAEVVDIGAPIKAALLAAETPNDIMEAKAVAEAKLYLAKLDCVEKLYDTILDGVKEAAQLTFETQESMAEIKKLVMEANDAATALDVANAAMINAQESYLTVLAEGEQVLSKRESLRKQAANRIAAARYQDMAFRTFRTDALAKYGNAFDFAKKYTYLATKAYDYETALGLDSAYSSDSIFCQVVGARNIGFMKDGQAQLGGLHGDGGLADILAQLKANWLVLKGRLGLNNPQIEQNWLSLRGECFRIEPSGTVATKAWRDKLSSCYVANLLENSDFQRYCLPFASSTGLKAQEPGLVIPFSTSIDFAKNVFGWDLAGNDHAFDSSYFATKIRKTGVKFIGYNQTTNGVVALSATPRVYLIPVGHDMMRSPGADGGDLLAYNVVDQVVPLPFPLSKNTLDDPDWTAVYTAYTGAGDPLATIRRYPSLRAYYDQSAGEDAMLSNTRLVGRSVWNTRWLLIIPAGALNADRDFALDALIKGADLNKDGKIDQPGIQDIQIGFETYSNSGN